jgi:hypothetical protein
LSERIVVSCRISGEEAGKPEARYLDRARAIAQRAHARGGAFVAWGATTVSFAWDPESLAQAVVFACEAAAGEGSRWSCAIARGEIELVAPGVSRVELAWGPPLLAATLLTRVARPGEVLVEAQMPGLDTLVATGKRGARDGEHRVRGVRIDARQPFRGEPAAGVDRLVTPPLVGRPEPRSLLVRPGSLQIIRADPGLGGTRMLAEIARAVAPASAIYVAPAGASVEPLGALRRALARALTTQPNPFEVSDEQELGPVLDMFLGGIGASIDQAAALVGAFLRARGPTDPPGALLIDDAGDIDAESLEACGQVIASMPSPFHVFVRVDATDPLPPALASLHVEREIELGPLARAEGEALAQGVAGGKLEARAARRIARRSGGAPLAITEALAFGVGAGELTWTADRLGLRTMASLAGKPATTARWISKRAKSTASDERGVLATIALMGGEAPVESVRDVLATIEPAIAVDEEVKKLVAARLLVPSQPGWMALPSRTHRETIADLLDEAPRKALSRAIADALEQSEGELGCAEAANHAVKGGDGERGARLALRAARAAQAAGMAKSANRLLTLARLADPKCEPLTRQQLATNLPSNGPPTSRMGSVPVPPARAPQPLAAPPSSGRTAWSTSEATIPGRTAWSDNGPPSEPEAFVRTALVAGPSHSSAGEDAPTQRLTAMNAAQAARLVEARDGDSARSVDRSGLEERDSDFPTFVNTPAYAPDRPSAPEAPSPARIALGARLAPPRPAEPGAPLEPPALTPRPGSAPRIAGRAASAVLPRPDPTAGLPKPSAPLPLRPQGHGMPASLPRPPDAPAPSRIVAPGRMSAQIAAVRAGVPAPASRPQAPPPEAAKTEPRIEHKSEPRPGTNGNTDVSVATRMIDLAKSALLEGDVEGIERFTEGLRAAGEHDRYANRMEAIGHLARGQVGEALRSLRALHETPEAPSSMRARAQSALALGVGLAAANRPDEALLEALDALARAREGRDARAAGACLAFLAKLYGRVQRATDAEALTAAARG